MNILITGVAGFIGFHTALKLLNKKNNVYGIDLLNNYYDVKIKKLRPQLVKKNLVKQKNLVFTKIIKK